MDGIEIRTGKHGLQYTKCGVSGFCWLCFFVWVATVADSYTPLAGVYKSRVYSLRLYPNTLGEGLLDCFPFALFHWSSTPVVAAFLFLTEDD